jgi:hypothetical protein
MPAQPVSDAIQKVWLAKLAGLVREAGRRGRRRIWLVSYPRSGNTLMREYLSILQGRPQYSVYAGDLVDVAGPRLTDALDGVMLVKTHQMPTEDDDPIVYLVRDGRNATLSFLYMSFLFGGHRFTRLEDAYDGIRFLDETEGGWAAHVRSALTQGTRRSLLVLRYEDLLADPAATLVRMTGFLGATLPQTVAEVCVEQQSARTDYEMQPGSGYQFEPEPGGTFAILKQHRREEYWRLILDSRCQRHLHLSGATNYLLRFGYEVSPDWWRDDGASG